METEALNEPLPGRTLRERICKKLFRIIYAFYRPKLGGRRIEVNRPFKVMYDDGTMSGHEYIYGQSRTESPTELGLFEGSADDRWYRRHYNDRILYMDGRHANIIYVK